MGLIAFATFQALLKNGHTSKHMGFRGTNGQVNVFANRMRVARSFRGIQLDGYTDASTLGYNAFFQVFLTHSALECYAQLIGLCARRACLPATPESETAAQVGSRKRGGCAQRVSSRWRFAPRTIVWRCYYIDAAKRPGDRL
jgi:hypothetical protein